MEITSDNASSNDTYISQKTEMSVPASPMVTPPGKLPHQTVFALPLEMMVKYGQALLRLRQVNLLK